MRNLYSIIENLVNTFNITSYVRGLIPRTTKTYNLMDDDKIEFRISTNITKDEPTVVILQTIAPLDGSDYKSFYIELSDDLDREQVDKKIEKYLNYYYKVKSQKLEYVRHLTNK